MKRITLLLVLLAVSAWGDIIPNSNRILYYPRYLNGSYVITACRQIVDGNSIATTTHICYEKEEALDMAQALNDAHKRRKYTEPLCNTTPAIFEGNK